MTAGQGLALQLKAATQDAHGALDQRIMACNPFASVANYADFVRAQYLFHRDVDALFPHEGLNRLLPGLAERRRLPQVALDLADLGMALPTDVAAPVFKSAAPVDMATALGWLYVEEGSNLGGAFLYKLAARLGLDAQRGARHLAPHAGGRAPSWKAFIAQMDAVPLDADGRARAMAGAVAAFERMRAHVEQHCRVERAPAPAGNGLA